jgi:hypothetical protein
MQDDFEGDRTVKHHSPRAMSLILAAAISASALGQGPCNESWVPGLSPHAGPNGPITAAKTLDLGSGPELFVTGGFAPLTLVSDQPTAALAKFDGMSWAPIGSNSPLVTTLVVGLAMTAFDEGSGPRLFVAGLFQIPATGVATNGIGRWDGTAWTIIGTATAAIDALTTFDDGTGPGLVAGGHFPSINGVVANKIARWRGGAWSPMGSFAGGYLFPKTFEVIDSGAGPELYAAGLGGGSGACVQRWNGSIWAAVGPTFLLSAVALCAHVDPVTGPGLFVVGWPLWGGPPHLARWDGTSWTALATFGWGAISAVPCALVSHDDGSGPALYIGGNFAYMTSSGGSLQIAMNLVRYVNGALQLFPGPQTSPPMLGMVELAQGGTTSLVAVGEWVNANGGTHAFLSGTDSYAPYVAKLTAGTWSSLSAGSWYRRGAHALTTFDDGSSPKLYAGGTFHTIGNVVANGFARWNGTSWEGIGIPGDNRIIKCMTVFDDGNGPALYVATEGPSGYFVFRWNGGSSFTQLGPTLLFPVTTMAVWDDGGGPKLWIGTNVDGLPGVFYAAHPPLRRWHNGAWEGLPAVAGIAGPTGTVSKLAVDHEGRLLIAGNFGQIGGQVALNVMRLGPGYSIEPLGGGLPNPNGVADIVVHDDGSGPSVWALDRAPTGVPFWPPFLPPTATVKRFDGSNWILERSLPGAVTGMLRSLPHGSGRALYVGGTGPSLSGLAQAPFFLDRLVGSTWSAFSLDGAPMDAVSFDDGTSYGVFVSGDFDMIGGVPSGSIAKLAQPGPTIVTHAVSRTVSLGESVSMSVAATGAAPLTYGWYHDNLPIPGATAPTLSIAGATLADAGSYSVVVTGACDVLTSTATLAVRGCELTIGEPLGPGVITITHAAGVPGGRVFTAVSGDHNTGLLPDAGPFFGLHIAIEDVLVQYVTQSPPFVTTLSASGTSFWGASPIPPQLIGLPIWGVSLVYDPMTLTVIGAPSNIGHEVLH